MLTKDHRPDEIHEWFQHGRKWNAMPDIGADLIENYSSQWWQWWTSLQPDWRGQDSSALLWDAPASGEIDWSATRKGGSNGLFVVLISLGQWFLGAKHNGGCGIEECERALDDVIWVLEEMVRSYSGSLKCVHDDSIETESPTKK